MSDRGPYRPGFWPAFWATMLACWTIFIATDNPIAALFGAAALFLSIFSVISAMDPRP